MLMLYIEQCIMFPRALVILKVIISVVAVSWLPLYCIINLQNTKWKCPDINFGIFTARLSFNLVKWFC